MKIIIFWFLVVLSMIFVFYHNYALVKRYRARPTFYREWLARYGKAHKGQIQRFLRCFGNAFFVSSAILHKLAPDDGVLDYYKEDYKYGGPDCCETVRLSRGLQDQFGYELQDEDGKLTIGQLFEKVSGIRRMENPGKELRS